MPIDKDLAKRIEAGIGAVREQLKEMEEQMRDDQIPDNVEQLQDEVTDLVALTGTRAADIESFFESVGKGVISAQRSLDDRSEEYLASLPSHALPSVFRIPKATAEIHFAMTKSQQKGFNVLVYGTKEGRELTQQNRVAFDIVSTPPPGEALTNLTLFPLSSRVVSNPAELDEIGEALVKFSEGSQGPDSVRSKAKEFADKIRSELIVIRGDGEYALIRPLEAEEPGAADTSPNIDVLYYFPEPRPSDVPAPVVYEGQARDRPPPLAPRFRRFAMILLTIAREMQQHRKREPR